MMKKADFVGFCYSTDGHNFQFSSYTVKLNSFIDSGRLNQPFVNNVNVTFCQLVQLSWVELINTLNLTIIVNF